MRIAIRLFSLVLVIPAILLLLSGIARSADKPLNNDDVIGLLKAGLSDAIVIGTIGRSQTQFDLSPEALLKLKQAGVSNAVIEAMFGSQAGQRQEVPAQTAPHPLNESTQQKAAKVYVGGVGRSPHIQTVLDDITDFLLEKKVAATQVTGREEKSRHQLVARVKEAGGESLLFLSLDTAESQSDIPFRGIRLKAQCFTADGERLWEDGAENIVWGTMPTAVNGLINKLKKKLDTRIGKPGLPVAK